MSRASEGGLDEELYKLIVEANKRKGLDFDTTAIINGNTVEFYKKGQRVKAHRVFVHDRSKDIK